MCFARLCLIEQLKGKTGNHGNDARLVTHGALRRGDQLCCNSILGDIRKAGVKKRGELC